MSIKGHAINQIEISVENREAVIKEYAPMIKYVANRIAMRLPPHIELDDLISLHYLVTSRKVTTILEIGVGKSTVVFDHGIQKNKLKYADFVKNNLRRSNPFECHSIDNNKKWIETTKLNNPLLENVIFHCCLYC